MNLHDLTVPHISPVLPAKAVNRRVSARSPVYMAVRDVKGGSAMTATDIGLGGLQCTTTSAHWPGQFLQLEFTLPELDEQVRVGAQVLSIDASSEGRMAMGLRFCLPCRKTKMLLYTFLEQRRALWDNQSLGGE